VLSQSGKSEKTGFFQAYSSHFSSNKWKESLLTGGRLPVRSDGTGRQKGVKQESWFRKRTFPGYRRKKPDQPLIAVLSLSEAKGVFEENMSDTKNFRLVDLSKGGTKRMNESTLVLIF
jgi:hypothetical protein